MGIFDLKNSHLRHVFNYVSPVPIKNFKRLFASGSIGNAVKPSVNKMAQPPFVAFLLQRHISNSTYISLMSPSLTSSRLHHVVITDFTELKTMAFCYCQVT